MKRCLPFVLLAGALVLTGILFQGCTIYVQPDPMRDAPSVAFGDPVLNQRRILLFGNITESSAEEAVQKLFYLDAQSSEPINLYLMTPGGDLKAAFAIVNAIQTLRARVNTYAFAECSSGGAMLLAAGTGDRMAFPGAIIVIHGMKVRGKVPVEFVDGMQSYYTAFWQRQARLPESWLPIPRNRIRILTAEQALEYGIIDKIMDGEGIDDGLGVSE